MAWESQKKWKRKNRDKCRAQLLRWRMKKLGTTPEGAARLLTAQGGLCAICKIALEIGKPLRERNDRSACLDHDHTTGKIRGFLCNNCNRGLGLFKDSAALLRMAAAYLGN